MATAKLVQIVKTLAHGDVPDNNNPSRKYVDWSSELKGIEVENPESQALTLSPAETKLIFDGTRSTSIDGTTVFSLVSKAAIAESRYRITFTGGTNPVFRTDRLLTLDTQTATLTANTNGTLTFSIGAGSLAAVVVGDTVFLPGLSTGDTATPFNTLNEGFWQVLAVPTSTNMQLQRPAGVTFQGKSEVVVITADAQVQAHSVVGVQVGDKVDISAGFVSTSQKAFSIVTVTSQFIEIISTTALPEETGVTPGVAGMIFYTNAKRLLRIVADQECVIRVNGDTGNTQRLAPWVPADVNKTGEYLKTGASWSLTIVNRAQVALNVQIITVE